MATRCFSVVLVALLVTVSAQAAGCTPNAVDLPWATDEYGRFHTRDLARAQGETPFAILVPEYLPPGLGEYPSIVGPLKGVSPETRVKVKVTYQPVEGLDSGKLITIEKYNYSTTPANLGFEAGVASTAVGDVEVVEAETTLPLVLRDRIVSLSGLAFMWDNDDLFYCVSVYGYDRDVALRVVESMVER